MLWFFALTEDSTAFRQYAEMLMVAVHTARKFTSLVPYFIYDGSDNDFTVWLRKHDVRMIRHRSLFRDALAELGRKKGNPISRQRFPALFPAWKCRRSWQVWTAPTACSIRTAT
jgi:hypothetical protein